MRPLTALLCLVPAAALAQDPAPSGAPHVEPAPGVRYAQRTEIDFLDELQLEGLLLKPRIQITIERIESSFNPLIKLRHSFDRELLESVSEVR